MGLGELLLFEFFCFGALFFLLTRLFASPLSESADGARRRHCDIQYGGAELEEATAAACVFLHAVRAPQRCGAGLFAALGHAAAAQDNQRVHRVGRAADCR